MNTVGAMYRKPVGVADIVVSRREMGGVERNENGTILERRECVRGKENIITATDFSHGWDCWDVEVHQSRGLSMVEGGSETTPPAHTAIARTGRAASPPCVAVVGGSNIALVCVASLPPLIPSLAPTSNVPPTKENNKKC